MNQIRSEPHTLSAFHALTQEEQEAFIDFCMGNRGLKITYDPFFKHIFDIKRHPERLSRLLSCLLGQTVLVKALLSPERRRISESSSLLIMDVLVQLSDGRIVDVEMQRVGYDFPVERGFCYAADLLLRQYDLISAEKKQQNKSFSYRAIKPIYVIVFMEQSSGAFLKEPSHYIHRSLFSFDTGLKAKSLQNFIYISLDIFREMTHNELTELEAWMYFLSSDSSEDILRILKKYPFFHELYQDIVNFRFHPKELIAMYSEALRIMDENTVYYMVDELRTKLAKKDQEFSSKLAKKDLELSKKDLEIFQLKAELEQMKKQNKSPV